MTDQLILCGLALPHDAPTIIRGVRETVAPWAIALDRGPVSLRIGDHAAAGRPWADTAAGTLQLFNYREGLGFRAMIDWSDPSAMSMARMFRAERWGVSVMFARGWSADEWEEAGQRHRRITAAAIEHVSIVWEPAYRTTACWPADMPTQEMGPELARLAARWDIGVRAFDQELQRGFRLSAADRRQGVETAIRVGRRAPAPSRRPSPPPGLVALMDSPGWREAAERSRAAAALMAACRQPSPSS